MKVLNMEFLFAKLPLRVNEPVNVLDMEFFSPRLIAVVTEPIGFRVQLVATPA